SRLVRQKGLDLLAHIMEDLVQLNIQLVVLGTGEEEYEAMIRHFAWKYPEKVSANIRFNNELAHKIYAASDVFLMPSLFEPCGLGQLIALRYGAIPIVRETGGLKDTVEPYNEETGAGNGFSFANYNAHDMLYTIRRAVEFYEQGEEGPWESLVKGAMKADYSWEQSARRYKELYESLLGRGESS
ncbi:MAG: glycosyltransferase, partial [Firmicutes bacterium]|nr:glycosyltransferase [Bacillota bacterium]